jgi:hypothetical protein
LKASEPPTHQVKFVPLILTQVPASTGAAADRFDLLGQYLGGLLAPDVIGFFNVAVTYAVIAHRDFPFWLIEFDRVPQAIHLQKCKPGVRQSVPREDERKRRRHSVRSCGKRRPTAPSINGGNNRLPGMSTVIRCSMQSALDVSLRRGVDETRCTAFLLSAGLSAR